MAIRSLPELKMGNAPRSHASMHLIDVILTSKVSIPRSPNFRCLCSFHLMGAYNLHGSGLVSSHLHFPGYPSLVRCNSGATASLEKSLSKRSSSDKFEKLWREFFSDTSQWWDNRSGKPNGRFPDFKNKHTGEGLWVIDVRNPPWVALEVASIPPGVSIVSRSQKLSRFNKEGQYKKTMEHFEQILQEGVLVDSYVFVHVLNACAALQNLKEGRRVHRQIIKAGCELNLHVSSCLVDMYSKCGSIDDALRVFNRMPERDVVTWTSMILGCVRCGNGVKALDLFQEMQREMVEPNAVTFVGALTACASTVDLEKGRQVHQQIALSGCESDIYVGSSLVDMYAKCGSIDDAFRVFNKMPTRDVVAWNAVMLGCLKCGHGLKVLEIFQQMQQDGIEPDSVTFVGLLNACASTKELDEGRRIHRLLIRSGLESDIYVGNSLVDMYSKCGCLDEALRVFNKMRTPDVAVWNAMILGSVKCGQGQMALELFQRMQQAGVEPDSVTSIGLLNACASIADLEEGRRVHKQVILSGFESDVFVCNSLVDMYDKCGSIEDSWSVFNGMHTRSVVSWTAMILACVRNGDCLQALELFQQMQQEEVEPDALTFVGVLNACAGIAALEEGKRVHKLISQTGCESDVYVCSSLVDMYAKCGSIDDARAVFDKMPIGNVVVWNALLMGYAMHGLSKEAVALFEKMTVAGSRADEVTFICLLSACSHGGLVKEGKQYFECMWSRYGVSPTQEHYTCMVDILGRAGHLDDAEQMIETMPLEPCAALWTALLGACRIHGNLEMGERASKRILELDPMNPSGYILLSNIYGAAGHGSNKAMIQGQKLHVGAMKQLGRSWIKVNNEVHSFLANDSKHPQIQQIQEELTKLSKLLKEAGHVSDIRFELDDVDEEKAVHLCDHSERLAVAFGLISTQAGAPLCIVQNLRVCSDCHTATKFISNLTGRAITVRDANRFHHFVDGVCSCKDCW